MSLKLTIHIQTEGDYQREFLLHRAEWLNALLDREAPPEDNRATCSSLEQPHLPQWRCLSCHHHPTFCTACVCFHHSSTPLHRVQFWNGAYFSDAWLRQSGVVINLGHLGSPCPTHSNSEGAEEPGQESDEDAISLDGDDSDWEDEPSHLSAFTRVSSAAGTANQNSGPNLSSNPPDKAPAEIAPVGFQSPPYS